MLDLIQRPLLLTLAAFGVAFGATLGYFLGYLTATILAGVMFPPIYG